MTRSTSDHGRELHASFAIRSAQSGDLEQGLGLLQSVNLPTEGVAVGWDQFYAVAETSGGDIVGVAGIEPYPPYALLRSVGVAPAWQGRQIAAALVRNRLAEIARRGLQGPYLLTTTAAGYFERQGFVPVKRSTVPAEVQCSAEFASVCPETATVMVHSPQIGEAKRVRTAVRRRYGAAARAAAREARSGCGCDAAAVGAACCTGVPSGPIGAGLYDALQIEALPSAAVLASLGCGNPTALIELREGETVLDLGSGGGIDVLLSARRVGPTGKVYGLDLTPDMVSLARRNAAAAGISNAEFMRGEIENIPLPDASVDVVISNCVINLSHDKPQALREAYRVLRPGGRFAVTDIVTKDELPESLRADLALWTSCVAGALTEQRFAELLASAGFTGVAIEPIAEHRLADLGGGCSAGAQECPGQGSEYADLLITSCFVRAHKPARV